MSVTSNLYSKPGVSPVNCAVKLNVLLVLFVKFSVAIKLVYVPPASFAKSSALTIGSNPFNCESVKVPVISTDMSPPHVWLTVPTLIVGISITNGPATCSHNVVPFTPTVSS